MIMGAADASHVISSLLLMARSSRAVDVEFGRFRKEKTSRREVVRADFDNCSFSSQTEGLY